MTGARPRRKAKARNLLLFAGSGVLVVAAACGREAPGSREDPPRGSPGPMEALEAPPPPPPEWAPLIGEYAGGPDTLSILEDGGNLYVLFWQGGGRALEQATDSTFRMAGSEGVLTVRKGLGSPGPWLAMGSSTFERLALGGDEGDVFRITPLRSPEELMAEALAATPPEEDGEFLPSDLVELISLDATLRLEIRYATSHNFMGETFYSSPRAFLQRPAAEALVRAHEWLVKRGYGLLIYDGYRPWYVTRMFWDATPEELRNFVADPASGSRHNRGCAVDLTLFDLGTGEVVDMPAGFDEMSPRSNADYPGGTERQRWYRKLLREAMEGQGFTVYPDEWWHFDHQDWRSFRIQNETFEELAEVDSGARRSREFPT